MSGMAQRCEHEDCTARADYRCELRNVGPRRIVRIRGTETVVQPYEHQLLCDDHTQEAVTAADPPPDPSPLSHASPLHVGGRNARCTRPRPRRSQRHSCRSARTGVVDE